MPEQRCESALLVFQCQPTTCDLCPHLLCKPIVESAITQPGLTVATGIRGQRGVTDMPRRIVDRPTHRASKILEVCNRLLVLVERADRRLRIKLRAGERS